MYAQALIPIPLLYIVSTPIGNLEDITLRAIRMLKEANLIVAEDTRHSRILLQKYEIHTQLESFHSHSNDAKLEHILSLLREGKNIALISDAGTPGISDPGFKLISRAKDENIPVTALPGPTAFVTAAALSGFPMDKLTFLGFLPIKKGRQTLFKTFKKSKRTIVFYESPHRIIKTVAQLNEIMPERKIALCREMTKLHEEVVRGTVAAVCAITQKTKPRGEYTVVLGPMKW